MKTKLIPYSMFIGLIILSTAACNKDFLDAKPSTDIVVPRSLEDFERLLDNTSNINLTGALGQMASDEYRFIDDAAWAGISSATQRNSYIWAKDIFAGELERLDWNAPYVSVFYANSVIAGLKDLKEPGNTADYNQVKGWALFVRSYAFYDLVRNFSSVYDPATATNDAGIPLRLNPEIDEILQRASVQQTYDQIIGDLNLAGKLLTPEFQSQNRNRPSKVAVFALLSRIYLSMNKYPEAELYADSTLSMYSKLIDYNTVSTTSATPFTMNNEETILNSSQILTYDITTNSSINTRTTVDATLIDAYAADDLRLSIYFAKNSLGNYYVKRGYWGSGLYPFSGLATDEIFLIKAECLARREEAGLAMDVLNQLLINRHNNATPYASLAAATPEEALSKILLERRKELVWRGLRWSDLKRLNKIGEGTTLSRRLNNVDYTLTPNDPRYVFPIPDDEITRSGIEQNIR